MRMYPREFPSGGRRKKPKRQAERRVYEALAGSDRRGFCYYEWRQGYEHIELDFAVWVERPGPFRPAGEGREIRYCAHRRRVAPEDPGRRPKLIESCPLDETKLAALDLHDDIKECGADRPTTRTSFRCWHFRTWSLIRPSGIWRSARACTRSGEPAT